MKVDCSTCTQRDIACGDCVVSLFLSFPSGEITRDELTAMEVMAEAGLVPHVRMQAPETPTEPEPRRLRIVS